MGVARIFELVAEQMPDVQFFDDGDAHGTPPAIWWDLGAERYSPGRQLGTAGVPGSLWTCATTVQLRIWGDGVAEVEELRDRLVNVLMRMLSQHSLQLDQGQWVTGSAVEKGAELGLTLLIGSPIVREDNPAIKPIGVSQTCSLDTTP